MSTEFEPVSSLVNETHHSQSRLLRYSEINLVRMQRLSRLSQRNMRVTLGKNKQEEKRLGMLQGIIEKNYAYDDGNWVREFLAVKKTLDAIGKNLTPYHGSSESNGSRLTSRRTNHSRISSKFSNAGPLSSRSPKVTSTPMSKSITKLRSYNAKKLDHYSQQQLNEHNQTSSYFTMNNLTGMLDDDSSMVQLNSSKYLTMPFFVNVKSYSSMLGAHHDKNQSQLDALKQTRNTSMSMGTHRFTSSAVGRLESYYGPSSTTLQEEEDVEDSTLLDKSVRRPRRQLSSSLEILNKFKTLSLKVKTVKEQQEVNLKQDDPNIRYGREENLKSTNRMRKMKQLKLLSKLESFK